MTFVRMRSAYSYPLENGGKRTIPAGWSGELDDEIASKAVDGGFTSEPTSNRPAARTGQQAAPSETVDRLQASEPITASAGPQQQQDEQQTENDTTGGRKRKT
jgi:hypothetical protein